MKPTRTSDEAGASKRHGTVTFSVRIDAKSLEEIQKQAEEIGYSANQFFVQSAMDSVVMINAPLNKSVKMPKLAAIGRFIKHNVREDLAPSRG